MNTSGSEFTLRVAICDLVERLKRQQHKCSYLEECRNQLVKEVIRLRLQNEWLAKQINDSPGPNSSLAPNQNMQQCFCNNIQPSLVNSPYNVQQCQMNGIEMGVTGVTGHEAGLSSREMDLFGLSHKYQSNGSVWDESLQLMNILNQFEQEDMDNQGDSIKNLTIQMLKDLEAEMKTGRLKSDLIQFVKGTTVDELSVDARQHELMRFDEFDEGVLDPAHTKQSADSSANYEAFNNNSDYYSNSHNLNIPLEQLYAQNANAKNYSESSFAESSTSKSYGKRQSTVDSGSSNLLKEEHNKSNSMVKNRLSTMTDKETTTTTDPRGRESTTMTATTIEHSSSSSRSNNTNIDLSLKDDELISVIVAVREDLRGLHQGLLSSNEKLIKIKSRQLRYYFQKQINLDNTGGSKSKSSYNNTHQLSTNGSNSHLDGGGGGGGTRK